MTARPKHPPRSSLVPGVERLRHYPLSWLRQDSLAGITVAAYLIPQCMAYGELAGVGPVQGLWAILLPLLLYTCLGTSPHLSVGPESSTAVMTAFMLLYLLFPGAVASLVTNDARAIEWAVVLLPIAGVFQIGDGVQVTSIGLLRGTGEVDQSIKHLFMGHESRTNDRGPQGGGKRFRCPSVNGKPAYQAIKNSMSSVGYVATKATGSRVGQAGGGTRILEIARGKIVIMKVEKFVTATY